MPPTEPIETAAAAWLLARSDAETAIAQLEIARSVLAARTAVMLSYLTDPDDHLVIRTPRGTVEVFRDTVLKAGVFRPLERTS